MPDSDDPKKPIGRAFCAYCEKPHWFYDCAETGKRVMIGCTMPPRGKNSPVPMCRD